MWEIYLKNCQVVVRMSRDIILDAYFIDLYTENPQIPPDERYRYMESRKLSRINSLFDQTICSISYTEYLNDKELYI